MYLAELFLLDHELYLLEGEAGSGSTDPTESGSNSDPDPQGSLPESEEKAAATLLNSFFPTMSCICWKKLDPDPDSLT